MVPNLNANLLGGRTRSQMATKVRYANNFHGPFTDIHDVSFTSSGGPLLVFFNGSAYGSTSGRVLHLCLRFDSAFEPGCGIVAENEPLSHKALASVPAQVSIPAGVHTFSIVDASGTTSSDAYDYYSVFILEIAPA